MNRRVRRTFSALIFLFVILPVPVFGLTFLGSWQVYHSTPGIAHSNSTDSVNNYTLTIGMGQVQPPSNVTRLSVSAVRDFQVANSSEMIAVSHAYRSMLKNGNISVNLSIQRFGVPNDTFNFPPYSFTAAGEKNPWLDYARSGNFHMGIYRVTITITYQLYQPGNSYWNNSSPHVFNFRGL